MASAVGVVVLAVLTLSGSGLRSQTPTTPWLEQVSPDGFGPEARPASAAWSLSYRVDATVRMPLLFAAIPLVSRESVGVTTIAARDYVSPDGSSVRTYELFAASFPERARGLNRLGFLREALVVEAGAVAQSAQFGVISADREDTREKADEAIARASDLLPYAVIDSRVGRDRATSRVVHMDLAGQWEDAAGLYREVRPRWDDGALDDLRELDNGAAHYEMPLSFLGALQHHLQRVADAVAADRDPRKEHRTQPYVHNGRLFRFDLRSVKRDGDRTREFAFAGWLDDPTALRRLDYRVRDAGGREVDRFKLWVELRAAEPGVRFPPPHLPLAYEYEPGSYLRLRAVRLD